MSLPAPFVRRIFSTTLLVLSGCGLPGRDTAPQDSAPADPWTDEISARIRDAAHAFVADGDTFTAESPGHGISGRFDGAGALLQREDEGIAVRSTRWGRANAMERISAAPPQLGACVAGREDPEGNCIPRLEYADAGLTEWWTATEDGFEQGWTLDAPPAGAGAVAIDVGVDGATVTVGDGEVWLHGDGGELWIVSGLVAWDADGTPLDARFELAEGGLRVTVDDAGARYPIEIDPVYSTASTTMTGSAGSSFGWSVSGAGDVNGDGYDDVIVGAYVHGSGAGQAYVYLGSAEGISTTASTTLTGEATRNYFGFSVSGAGDVNGDGYDDVIVGASGYSSDLGRAYVFEGSATGVASGSATTADATLTGEARPNSFGISVSGAGDVNGDGYDDVIVGADYYSSSTGRAYVFEGSATGVATGIATTADTALTGGAMFDNFAYSVSGAGDVDGDGYDDVIVGAYQYSLGTGRAYVFQGSATGVASRSTTTADTTLTGEARSYYFGRTVSGAGDVNGDGYDDVIVGEPFHGSGAGRASVFAGSATGVATALSTAASTTLTGETASDNFGLSVSGAGDVNGDGYDDVIVGAYYHNSGTGRAYVFGGSGTGLATTADTTLNGVDAYAYFGCSVSGAGDVNGDGYDDVIVGAWAHSSGTGRVYVHHGYEDADGDGYVATNDCDDTDASVTVESTFYADADGDSYGSAATSVSACEAPTGYVVDTTDCDDAVAAINPAATEVCDAANTDEDCDGLADDFSAAGLSTFYTDLDSDGYGSDTTGSYCDMPPGYVTESGDCDDTNPAISPSATEVCDAANTDENCDGLADDASATGRSTFYA
ncbi:MAG: FG-GAP-like repeat-containing protein, partial [Myxococcota bacterium]